MFGFLPAKDLYLAELRRISDVQYKCLGHLNYTKTIYFDDDIIYAIVKKDGSNYHPNYIDVFSKTSYQYCCDVSEKGKVVIKEITPLMTISKYVKISDLQRILIEKNNILYDENKVKKLKK